MHLVILQHLPQLSPCSSITKHMFICQQIMGRLPHLQSHLCHWLHHCRRPSSQLCVFHNAGHQWLVISPPINRCVSHILQGARLLPHLHPIYPRPPNMWHHLDPILENPVGIRRFYVITRGTKIRVFWADWYVDCRSMMRQANIIYQGHRQLGYLLWASEKAAQSHSCIEFLG